MTKHTSPQNTMTTSLNILANLNDVTTAPSTRTTLGGLQRLFEMISLVTGLDVCIYPPPRQAVQSSIKGLPTSYTRHMSLFCRTAKKTRDDRGCRGFDSALTNGLAAESKQPFVQTCHRGIAEVIVPVFNGMEHLGTVFVGQVVTPQIEARGFDAIWEDAKSQVVSRKQLAKGFDQLPRMSEEKLLAIGMLVDAAIRSLAGNLSDDMFAMEVRLQSAPAIRRAVDILYTEHCWDITSQEMAHRVHLSPTHFSRVFHKVMDKTFSRFLNDHRMTTASTLLHQSSMTIAQVAQRCGFSRQSYFTRLFKEHCGMTPTQFRSNSVKL